MRWRRVALYYALTVGITAAATRAWSSSGGSWEGTRAAVVLNLCMLVPGFVAWLLTRVVFHEPVTTTLALRRPSPGWVVTAWLLAPAIMLLAAGLALALPAVAFEGSPAALGLTLAQGLVVGPTLCAIGGLGEELGWRGWLHHELEPLGAWQRAAVIGFLWGGWHLPVVFQGYAYPTHPLLGSLLLLALTQLLAPLYARLRERSGSVLVPAVFHGTCGGTGAVAAAFVRGGNELTVGFTGLAGVVSSALVAITFLAATARRR